jgi:hypothetical protein
MKTVLVSSIGTAQKSKINAAAAEPPYHRHHEGSLQSICMQIVAIDRLESNDWRGTCLGGSIRDDIKATAHVTHRPLQCRRGEEGSQV